MTARRRTIARRLVEAQHTAAMLTTFNEVDMSAVMEVRKRRKDSFKERHGVNLGFMSFFTKAAIGALKAFPRLNAEIQNDEIVLKRYYDIGIAVGAEEGLVVPWSATPTKRASPRSKRTSWSWRRRPGKTGSAWTTCRGVRSRSPTAGVFGSLLSTPILNTPAGRHPGDAQDRGAADRA
jgi:2-oxoglutarate dehydrogenase E2 component (dihydrolipoamide succinyltransferase)